MPLTYQVLVPLTYQVSVPLNYKFRGTSDTWLHQYQSRKAYHCVELWERQISMISLGMVGEAQN